MPAAPENKKEPLSIWHESSARPSKYGEILKDSFSEVGGKISGTTQQLRFPNASTIISTVANIFKGYTIAAAPYFSVAQIPIKHVEASDMSLTPFYLENSMLLIWSL